MSNVWFRLAVMSFVGIIMSVMALAIIPLFIPNSQSHSGTGHQTVDPTYQVDNMSQYPNQYQSYYPTYPGNPGYAVPMQGQMFPIQPVTNGYPSGLPYQGIDPQGMNPYNPMEYNLMKMQIEQLKLQLMEMQMQLQSSQGGSSSSMSGMGMM